MIKRLTMFEVKAFIESKGCRLLDEEYKNNSTKLNLQCKCGNYFAVDFNTFKKGQQQCKTCGMKLRGEKRRNQIGSKHEYYSIEKVTKIINAYSDVELLSNEYKGCFDKLEFKCGCGKLFYEDFSHVRRKINKNAKLRCPKCSKVHNDSGFRYTEKEINDKIFKKYGYKKFAIYDYENYTNTHNKNLYIHNECGHIFSSNLTNLLYSDRLCPKCELEHSSGVYRIMKYLNDNNIEFELEKTFDDCKYERRLPFDFYIPHYDCCIEYDGEQHFRATKLYGGKKNLKKIQLRDSIKNSYCKENNIPLLRISFKENNEINNIINNFIDKLIPR